VRCRPWALSKPLLTETVQHEIEQQSLCTTINEPTAELAQHRVIKSWIVELQAECVLPINPSTDAVSGLAVGQVLDELEHGDQGQAPRALGRLPAPREQLRKIAVFHQRLEFVSHSQIGIATRKRRVGDTRRLLRDGTDGLGL
jgi:hypothetical protein